MLPSPVSSGAQKGFNRLVSRRNLADILLSRSRITNCGVTLLVILTSFSLYHNLRFWLSSSNYPQLKLCQAPTTSFAQKCPTKFGSSWWATVAHPPSSENLEHLVIVPGHAVWTGHDPGARLDESQWILEPYRKGKARLEALYQHIQRGLSIARGDEHALVVFSGGQTRLQTTVTEAQSYLRLALSSSSITPEEDVYARLTTEDFALDSFQNLLFSIARFKEFTGRYPDRISVVGYEFKKPRFENLHRAAIRWPENKFTYYGIDPYDSEHVHEAIEGERKNGFIPYSKDAYGCHHPLLDKRQRRNPFRRFHSYYLSAPELSQLLDWCPGSQENIQTYFEPLPWDPIS